MKRARKLIALLEGYAPTQREWMAIILGAAGKFGMCPEDLKSLRQNLENEVVARFRRGDVVRLENDNQPWLVERFRDRVVPAEVDVSMTRRDGTIDRKTVPADSLLIVAPARRRA